MNQYGIANQFLRWCYSFCPTI